MKARLAKKIIKNKPKPLMRVNKMSIYWVAKWLAYELRGLGLYKCDCRIIEAIRKTEKHDRRSI